MPQTDEAHEFSRSVIDYVCGKFGKLPSNMNGTSS